MSNQHKPLQVARWRTVRYWQELYIYFWVFALLGHYLELLGCFVYTLITGNPPWQPISVTVIPLSAPYGLGIVAIILFVVPLMRHYKLQPLSVFVLSIIAASIVEYASAMLVVIFEGQNKFWNYTNLPYNFDGQISLRTSVAFGILACLFVYGVYPFCEKLLARFKNHQINIIFWILLIAYLIDLGFAFVW